MHVCVYVCVCIHVSSCIVCNNNKTSHKEGQEGQQRGEEAEEVGSTLELKHCKVLNSRLKKSKGNDWSFTS